MSFIESVYKNKKKRRAFPIGLLLLLLMFLGNSKVYAQEASVTFGQDSYSVTEETFAIDVLVRAEGNIGIYKVILRYDTDRMEYISGAEEAADGRIVLEGTGFGSEVAYVLEFRAIGGGSAGLAVEDAWIYSSADGETDYTIGSFARVPVDIQGQETGGLSFFARLDEEARSAAAPVQPDWGSVIHVAGSIADGSGNIMYIIDMVDYEPDVALWDYTLVTGSYQEETFTYISDQGRNVRVVLMMDGSGSPHLYAYKEEDRKSVV